MSSKRLPRSRSRTHSRKETGQILRGWPAPNWEWEPMVLYRFFDADGALLYVGITNHPTRRFSQHAAEKPWWHEVDDIEFEFFPGPRHVAEAEEAVAIWEEQPRYNKHSPIQARYYPNHGPRANDTVEIYDSMAALFDGIANLYAKARA